MCAVTRRLAHVVLAALVLAAAGVHAQGILLQRNESGLAAGSGLFGDGNLYGVGFAAGYSFGGVVDVGIGVARSHLSGSDVQRIGLSAPGVIGAHALDAFSVVPCYGASLYTDAAPRTYPHPSPADLSVATWTPSLTVHLLKETRPIPVSLAVEVAYERSIASCRAPSVEVTSRGYSLGASLYRSFALPRSFSVVPEAGIVHHRGTSIIRSAGAPEERQYDSRTSLVLAAHVTSRLVWPFLFHLSPQVELGRDRRLFQLSAGVVVRGMR